MLKFLVFISIFLSISLILNIVALEKEKDYTEPTEKKNTQIYPFYELWGYIALAIGLILAFSTIIHKRV